eukprot:scaffold15069_cov61-Phaeocystis_antarctica.AAC.1
MNPPLLLHSPVVAHAAQSFSLSSHLSSLYCFLAAAASSATSCVDFPGGAWLQALNPSFHVCSALSDSEHFPAQSPPVLQQFALPSLFLPQVAQACPTSAGFPAAGVVVALVTRDEGSPSGPIWLVDSAAVGRAVDTAAALASGHSAKPTERMASRIVGAASQKRMPYWADMIPGREGTPHKNTRRRPPQVRACTTHYLIRGQACPGL